MGTTIAIGGLIAAGKTTLIKKLADQCLVQGLSCRTMLEMFTDSVRTMVRKNLLVEDAFMFAHRLQMALDAPDIAKAYDVVLMERSFIDHLAFVEAFGVCGLVPKDFVDWANNVVQEVAPPITDRYVYLDIAPELACERRTMRGSSNDGVFNLEFMRALNNAYERLIPLYYDRPLILDWSNFGDELCLNQLILQLLNITSKKLGLNQRIESMLIE